MFERKAVLLREHAKNSVLIGCNEVTDRALIIGELNGFPLPAGKLVVHEVALDATNRLISPQEILSHRHR